MTQAIPHQLRAIASQVGRLLPDWRNPETYFQRRDELERELRALARDLEENRNG